MNTVNQFSGPGFPKKRKPIDKTIIGLLSGLLFGTIGLLVVYFVIFRHFTFAQYANMFFKLEPSPAFAAKALSLAMICNLAPFYFFLNKKAYQGTKGVIIATALMGVLFILYKFVW
jgi:RsiW-degrading membrane proteinase PrsW (M82 family)